MVYGNRRNFLNNLPLKWKKIGIFGFLILLFAVLFGINLSVFNNFQRIASEKILLMNMMEDLLEARFAAMELQAGKPAREGSESVEANVAELENDARPQVESLFEDPALRDQLLGVIDGAVAYGQSFENARDVQLTLEGRLDEIESLSADVEGDIERLADIATRSGDTRMVRSAYEVEQNLAKGRLLAERFLWRENPERLAAAQEAFAAALRAADQLVGQTDSASDAAEARSVRDAIEVYVRNVAEAAQLTQRRSRIFTTELDEVGPQIKENLEAIIDARFAVGGAGTSAGKIQSLQRTLLIASTVAMILATFACWFLIRAVVTPLRVLTDRLRAVADGNTDFAVRKDNSADEMGTMWTALGRLREGVEEAYARAQMIDQLPNPVAVADPANEMRIAYMNEAAHALFASMSGSSGGRDDLVGEPVDTLLGDRAEARHVLRDPAKLPWRGRVAYRGGEHVDLKASAVRDKRGKHVGTMLALRRVTDQVRSTSQFETSIKASVDQIAGTFEAMRSRIASMAQAVEETQGQLSEGAEAVTEATSAVQMVASASEELSSSISEIAGRLSESTRRANDAATSTTDVARRAQELATVSKRITEVVETISDIADKTNLLALNATIEAASAGEAGKGFAVVAAEVKNLANQTAKATDEVSSEMAAIQEQIRSVTEGITSVAQVIEEINGVFASISAAAEQQQAATREITVNAHNAAGGAETAATTIRVVTSSSASNLDATRALTRAAEELAEANDNLSRESDAFLSTMKGGT